MAAQHTIQVTRSPVDGRVIAERKLADSGVLNDVLARASAAAAGWACTPIDERIRLISAMVDDFVSRDADIAKTLTLQMGRPTRFASGEVAGFGARARHMLDIAPAALADVVPPPIDGFQRFIRREPLGLVLVLAPWNYPYLTAVNAVVPALASGNVVVLKHSDQTPLCSEEMVASARAAGIPADVFQFIHMSHDRTAEAIADARVQHVCFTGSVEGGHAVVAAARDRFIGMGLELGGKDPAYVRADADVAFAAENVIEGALFNSGQSCCGIERVYVHTDVYDQFIAGAVNAAKGWVLGDPTHADTTLGPVVRDRSAAAIQRQIDDAIAAGATPLLDPRDFPAHKPGTRWMAPQILVDVTHDMDFMREETFGPCVGVMRVSSDDEAIRLMNDSRYGLTASIWSRDADAAMRIGTQLETGTVFLNRCDYLDPGLAWTGVKDSGRGVTLSSVGFEHLTRARSFHFRMPT